MTIDTRELAISLLAKIKDLDPMYQVALVETALDRAQAAGFADGYNERDTEIPTGDDP